MKPADDPTQSRFDLIDAFANEECAICALGRKSVERRMDAINYDSVGDPGVRQHFLVAGGYCNVHAHQWLHTAFVLGTASLYHELLAGLMDQVRSVTRHPQSMGDRIGRWLGTRKPSRDARLPPAARCAACAWLADTEAMLIDTLIHELTEPAFRAAFTASTGLCIPHLHQASLRASTDEALMLIRDRALRTETLLLAQLAEIIRKHDYRFSDERPGDEVGAAGRAVAHVSGYQRLTTTEDGSGHRS